MAVTDPRIFAQSVGLGNLPQLYATNIQAPDISPIQRAQQLSMQEQQFSTSLAMRQQEFKQRERAFELDELEKRLAFDDKLGAKFLSADMPTVYKVMDEIGLSQALEGPLKASEIVPLYKQFHQHERIQALTAKKSLTDNLLNYAKENKDTLGKNATAYRSQVLSTASNPNATIQDLASIDPRVFDYYDYRGLIEDQIARNKDLTKEEKRQAIRNFITADPQAKRQLVLDGMVKEGDTTEDVVDRLSSIYAVSGKESENENNTASSAEFRGAYSPTGKSYISEADRQKAASIASGSGSTKEERLQPMESTKTFLFDNLRNNKDWIEDQTSKVDLDAPLARDSQGFLDLGGTAPSREELARADKSVERVDGNLYIKANTDVGTVYYNVGPDSQLIEDNAPPAPTELVDEFKGIRRNYVDGALQLEESEGQEPGTSVNIIDANDTELLDSVEERFQSELGRYPSSGEIADIFGTNSPAYKIYQKANVIADAALRGDGSIARMNAGAGQIEEVTPTNSVLGLPSNMSSLTATPPMGTVEGIEQATGTNLNELTASPPTVRENINTTIDESENEEGIVPAPAIPVERAKELVENEEDVPIIDEVIRSVKSMSKSTIDSIREATGIDLGELIAQGPPAPAQTPPRAIELGSTSPGGGGGGGGWGEAEPPNSPPNRATSGTTPEEETVERIAGAPQTTSDIDGEFVNNVKSYVQFPSRTEEEVQNFSMPPNRDPNVSAAFYTYNPFNLKGKIGSVPTTNQVDPVGSKDGVGHRVYKTMEEGWKSGIDDIFTKLDSGKYDNIEQLYGRFKTGNKNESSESFKKSMGNLISAFDDLNIRVRLATKLKGSKIGGSTEERMNEARNIIEKADLKDLRNLVGDKAIAMAVLKAENGQIYKKARNGMFSDADTKYAIFSSNEDIVDVPESEFNIDGEQRMDRGAYQALRNVKQSLNMDQLDLESGFRSPERQWELRNVDGNERAVHPYASKHNSGKTIDVSRKHLSLNKKGNEFYDTMLQNGFGLTYNFNHFEYNPNKFSAETLQDSKVMTAQRALRRKGR